MRLYTDGRSAVFRSVLTPLLLQALFVGPTLAQAGPDTPAKAAAREQMRLQRSLFDPLKLPQGNNPVVQGVPLAIPAVVNTNPPRAVPVEPSASLPMPAAPIPQLVDRFSEPDVLPTPASRGTSPTPPVLDRVPPASQTSSPPEPTKVAPTVQTPPSTPALPSPRKLKVDL